MGRKKASEPAGNPNGWMATFADLLSLLVTFFVLLFSMKSLDKGKLEDMLGYFRRGGLGVLLEGSRMPLISADPMALNDPGAKPISPADIDKLLTREGNKHRVGVSTEDRGLILTISSGIPFDSGLKLKAESLEALDNVIQIVKKDDYGIQVVGHTDNRELVSSIYETRWDLSIARAGHVARYLIHEGKIAPHRVSVVGFADTKPVQPNDTAKNRARNRRVDLVLMD